MAQAIPTLRRLRIPAPTVHAGLTGPAYALATLEALVGLSAAVGAVLIVPGISEDLFRYQYLTGGPVPVVGLAVVAILSLAAASTVLTGHRRGAALSVAAGVALVVYELAESLALGNLLTPPAGVHGIGTLLLWLQPVFVVVGLAMIVVGGRIWSYGARPIDAHPHLVGGTAANRLAIALTVVALLATSVYGWAAASSATSMEARFLAWGMGTTYDWTRFPSRPLPAASTPSLFPEASLPIDLAKATGSANPDQFFTSSDTTAVLAIQHGTLVLERYFNGATRSRPITAFSDTKSWDSALVGAAIADGYITSVDDRVTKYIPELAGKDPRFSQLTLRDLLAMRSGLAMDRSGLIANDDSVLYNTPALRQAVLDRVRFASAPGSTFSYNDFNHMLLGLVLERATGRTVTQWLDETLWQPMGAQQAGAFLIDSTSGGFEKMASGLTGIPLDLVRIGELYLHVGAWQGTQVIPRAWVAETTDYATGSPTRFPGVRYGMGWWTRVIDGQPVFYAWGDHGEFVLVVPGLDTVVARFGRQFGFGAPAGDSTGGNAGVEIWPTVLTHIAEAAATRG